MASKKKNVDQVDMFGGALAGAGRVLSEAAIAPTERAPAPLPARLSESTVPDAAPMGGGSTPPAGAPKLRLVPPQPDEDVTIEPDDSGFFWVSFVRHDGTTRGAVRITRRQVEMLLARAPIALEMSK